MRECGNMCVCVCGNVCVCVLLFCRCVDDVSQGVKPLLYHVTSVKGLNSIRAALHVLLAQVLVILGHCYM